jgi:hypothetical protein
MFKVVGARIELHDPAAAGEQHAQVVGVDVLAVRRADAGVGADGASGRRVDLRHIVKTVGDDDEITVGDRIDVPGVRERRRPTPLERARSAIETAITTGKRPFLVFRGHVHVGGVRRDAQDGRAATSGMMAGASPGLPSEVSTSATLPLLHPTA